MADIFGVIMISCTSYKKFQFTDFPCRNQFPRRPVYPVQPVLPSMPELLPKPVPSPAGVPGAYFKTDAPAETGGEHQHPISLGTF
ncbi:MAG: hypothetical protein EA408_00695 [Marinilabiliales bacterium]|nr:MAG: hypothetical protein EA408_00695 [Marinilabiliales bacterium]